MSVTFAPAMDSMQYQLSCSCGEAVAAQVFPSFEVAYKAFQSPIPFEKPVCSDLDCAVYSGPINMRIRAVNEEELSLNLCNSNAGYMAEVLDLPREDDALYGAMEGQLFLTRVQEAIELFSVLARKEDYIPSVLQRMLPLATYAAERNAEVVWA